MKLASVIQFTFSGVPSIYYGDEIGMDGGEDPDCRKCMEWDEAKQDRELFRFYAELVRLRLAHRALRSGTYEVLCAESGKPVLAYAREADGERFIVAVNAGARAAALEAACPSAAWAVVFGEAELSTRGSTLSVLLPPYGYAILRAAKTSRADGARSV